ncbi:MAG: hypothetical protein NE334_14070 [Lentisphaeraceae bacterium]|nr:hypothetical protein [Lentisphaeraceae bacterium]
MYKTCVLIFLFSVSSIFGKKPETPGTHKNNQCDNGSKYSFHVYIPKAYATKKDKSFPVLYISSPGGNPGFMKLEQWAEENEFLLITINESKNAIPWETIFKIQDDVMKSTSYLRKHHALQFATGFSGSAWASVHLANRYPKNIAGVFMNCHSGNGTVLQDKTTSVALVAGNSDKTHNASYVQGVYNSYKKRGFHAKYENLVMGHKWAPLDKFKENLNFLYGYQKFANAYLTPEEKKQAYEELEMATLKKAADNPNKEAVISQLEGFMSVKELMKSKLATKIYHEWAAAVEGYVASIKESEPAKAYFYLKEESVTDTLTKVPSKSKTGILTHFRDLSRTKVVVDEIKAAKKFEYYERQASRVRNKKTATKLITKIEAFIKTCEGTFTAERATSLIKTLQEKK